MKSHKEWIKADKYYGRPTPGEVLLVNGFLWHFDHYTAKDVEKHL
jgi:hypothetical protein